MSYLPLVGLPADTHENAGFMYHSIGDKYVRAVAEAAQCTPVMIPSMIDALEIDALLDHFDGILMTGAVSNVHPPHYGEQPSADHEPYDHARDATTLKLIDRVIARGIPLFCICRGFQELNVALGGTLHTQIHKQPGKLDHRGPMNAAYDEIYQPAHPVIFEPASHFARLLGKSETMVNTVHWQGLDRVADRLTVEGRAPDGVVEAVRVKDAAGFALGAQWHPEYRCTENPDSMKLFQAFGQAARDFATQRRGLTRPAAE